MFTFQFQHLMEEKEITNGVIVKFAKLTTKNAI